MMMSSSSQVEEKKRKHGEKKNHKEGKNVEKGGNLVSFLNFAFGMKCFFCLLLSTFFNVEHSTFLKPCVSHFLEGLCYSSLGALSSFGDGVSRK